MAVSFCSLVDDGSIFSYLQVGIAFAILLLSKKYFKEHPQVEFAEYKGDDMDEGSSTPHNGLAADETEKEPMEDVKVYAVSR